MPTFKFTLLLDDEEITDNMLDDFRKVGCSDALLHKDEEGVKLSFCRAATCAYNALNSAQRAVRKAGYTYNGVTQRGI